MPKGPEKGGFEYDDYKIDVNDLQAAMSPKEGEFKEYFAKYDASKLMSKVTLVAFREEQHLDEHYQALIDVLDFGGAKARGYREELNVA